MIRFVVFLFLIGVQLKPAQNTIFFEAVIIAGSNTTSCSVSDDILQQVRNKAAATLRDIVLPLALQPEYDRGLWTRVAYLNMGDPTQSCPSAWRDRSANRVRVCGRPAGSNNQCHSTIYSTSGLSYNRVGGRIIGYQFGDTDAFHSGVSIDQPYVEGVSITHGNPRSHIWTLAAGHRESGHDCPCEGGLSAPSYVGHNYYCESGHNGTGNPSSLHTSDPLWDGAGCESEGSCCRAAPWFTVDLVIPTSDNIEVRICANYLDTEEDTPIHLLELYIQRFVN